MRCNAGNNAPGLTLKVPLVICAMRFETPSPCSGPRASDFSTRRSSVPCNRSTCLFAMFSPIDVLYVVAYSFRIECQYESQATLLNPKFLPAGIQKTNLFTQ